MVQSPREPRVSVHYEPAASPTPTPESARPAMTRRAQLTAWLFGVPGIIVGGLLGILIGYFVQRAHPSETVVSWIGIPGELFIRAVKCLVPPLVFCSLIVGTADMLAAGKASTIGWRTLLLYVLTTVLSSTQGMIWVLLFRSQFGNKAKADQGSVQPAFALQCSGEPGYFLQRLANGTVSCVYDATFNTTQSFSNASVFEVTDIHKSFAMASKGFVRRSLSAALQSQLFAIVPSNITLAFSEGTLLSIIMFAIPFGVAIALLPPRMKTVANFIQEVNTILMTMIHWIIKCTPFAIISLLAQSIAVQDDLSVIVSDVGLYVACALLSLFTHTFVTYPALLRIFVPGNPFGWLRKIARAQAFAFASSSSMASLPVVMECIEATGIISKTLSRFVLSLGATIGMDGAALVYPISIVFMAEAQGIGHIVGTVEYFLIILVTTIGAVGAGPVPSAGSVMTITIWNSVFPSVPLPSTFAYIVATDWFIDRFQTAVNVTCDAIVCRIVAEQVGEALDEHDRASVVSVTDELVEHKVELREVMSVTAAEKHEV